MSWKDRFRNNAQSATRRPRNVHQTMHAGPGSMTIQSGGDISGISQFAGDDITRMKVNNLDITYDSDAGMMYVTLPAGTNVERDGGILTTRTVNDSPLVNFDFDRDNNLVGIEIAVDQ